jgi:preprotein translocase subunit SecE
MANRAVRRQQLKEAKPGARTAPRSLPRTGPPRPAREAATRNPFWKPRFIMDIISELRKVVWPTRDDVVHLTVVVVIMTVLIGATLGAIDIGFGWIVDRLLLD